MKSSILKKRNHSLSPGTASKSLDDQYLRISTGPEELREGLFGQIILYIMEILPELHDKQIYPCWEIRSLKYGSAPDYLVLPGVVDINYEPVEKEYRTIDLEDVRKKFIQVLGDDWEYMNMLWNTYFRIPERVIERADRFGDLSGALGLHFRGTDKNQVFGQTNPVSHDDFLTLVDDFLKSHPEIDTIFLATDEFTFVQRVEEACPGKKVMNTGEVTLFWDLSNESENPKKGDHAMLDCLLLSRCRYVIKCQSALSGFSKVINPGLEAYRISANKMSMDIPYFPDAYFPRLQSSDPECQKILSRLFKDDWLDNRKAHEKFGKPFRTMNRPGKGILYWTFKWFRNDLLLRLKSLSS